VKAIGVRRWGGPEVLEVLDRPAPHAGPGEVRVRVRAAAVNPVDLLIRQGESAVPMRSGQPVIPGLDVAGTVDEVGPGGTTDLAVGDDVMAMINPTRPAGGGYAELVVLPENWVVPIPAGLSHPEAAALPMSGLTALRALDLVAIRPSGTLAVTGAAGLVGGYAVQLAKAQGYRVLDDAALHRGPAVVEHFRAGSGGGVDALIDAAAIGAPVLPAIRRGGTLVQLRTMPEPFGRAAAARGVQIVFALVHDYDGRRDKLDHLRRLAADGLLVPRVAATYPPGRAAEAHRRQERGGVGGRLVIVF
jgi:NADPH:quinone reductase-like Zn-dependent oxidoreductase